jgi:hypothetical protein
MLRAGSMHARLPVLHTYVTYITYYRWEAVRGVQVTFSITQTVDQSRAQPTFFDFFVTHARRFLSGHRPWYVNRT